MAIQTPPPCESLSLRKTEKFEGKTSLDKTELSILVSWQNRTSTSSDASNSLMSIVLLLRPLTLIDIHLSGTLLECSLGLLVADEVLQLIGVLVIGLDSGILMAEPDWLTKLENRLLTESSDDESKKELEKDGKPQEGHTQTASDVFNDS